LTAKDDPPRPNLTRAKERVCALSFGVTRRLASHRRFVLLFPVFVIPALILSAFAYSLESYSNPFNASLTFVYDFGNGSQAVYFVNLGFHADGPVSAGYPVTLDFAQLFGDPPAGTEHVIIDIFGGRQRLTINQPLPASPWGDLGYYFNVSRTTTFHQSGLVNLTVLLSFWTAGQLLLSLMSSSDGSQGIILVEPGMARLQYDSTRLAVAAAVGSFVFAGLPTGLQAIRELSAPAGGRKQP